MDMRLDEVSTAYDLCMVYNNKGWACVHQMAGIAKEQRERPRPQEVNRYDRKKGTTPNQLLGFCNSWGHCFLSSPYRKPRDIPAKFLD